MISVMGRIRVYFDAEDDLKLALKLRAAKEGKSISSFIENVLKAALAKELDEARKAIKQRKDSEE